MKNYFSNCTTCEELKKAYKKAAKELHPDNGGNAEEFKKMQSVFSDLFEKLKNTHKNAKGETYTKTGDYATKETAAEFMGIIDKIVNIPGVIVELIGSWLWVSGNTKESKDIFKSLGFHFSGSKKAWYFHFEPYRKKSSENRTLDELRDFFGSETFRPDNGPDKPFLPC